MLPGSGSWRGRRWGRAAFLIALAAEAACAPVLAPRSKAPPLLAARFDLRGLVATGTSARAAKKAAATALRAGDLEAARAAWARAARGPDALEALVALGELEARHGLLGTAAVHLARADVLDGRRLAGSDLACGLFLRRAARLLALGAAEDAYRDVARADRLCPVQGEHRGRVRLRRRVLAAVRGKRSAGIRRVAAGGMCDRWSCAPVSAEVLVRRLQDEAHGALGPVIVPDEVLAAWVAGRPYDVFAPTLRKLRQGWRGYVRLRLRRVLPVPEQDGEGGEGVRDRGDVDGRVGRIYTGRRRDLGWVAAAQSGGEVPVGALVRAFVLGSDPGSALAVLRLDRGAGWAETVEGGELAVRLQMASGRLGTAMAVADRFARKAARTAEGRARLRSAVRFALAWGSPYLALALLPPEVQHLADGPRRAVAGAIGLVEAWCGASPCVALQDRRAAVAALGEAEVVIREAALAVNARPAAAGVGPCSALSEAVAAGDVVAPNRRTALRHRVEADPALACLAEVPAVAGDPVQAGALLALLSLSPDPPSTALLGLSVLAYRAGDPARGRRLLLDAVDRWGEDLVPRAAEVAAREGDLEAAALLARRRWHRGGPERERAHRALVLGTLCRANTFEGRTPAGRAAMARAVRDYVAAGGDDGGWIRRHHLAEAVVEGPDCFDRGTMAAILPILFPSRVRGRFPRDVARLLAAAKEGGGRPPPGPRDDPALALLPADDLAARRVRAIREGPGSWADAGPLAGAVAVAEDPRVRGLALTLFVERAGAGRLGGRAVSVAVTQAAYVDRRGLARPALEGAKLR